ncbi:hypothetical protein CK203_057546 [Vitis vinifera]|uniref:Uncharacterized protein n=1 Tax=Vitis vinifera TaxID=29760 RepID=A0A438GGX4_VITVI|nr:hypothetical protein CK203_057546 [Vitis vinifera]
MSEGFFFGPHHLIMAALLYFEEKVHKKKLQRADCIPLLFPRLLCQVLEHLGYPSEPQQERKRICREPFTLDKWNNMTAYKIDQPGQPQPAARRASPRHPPEVLHLLLLPSLELHQLHLLHHSHPHQLSRGWPSLYPNIESCAEHWRLLQLPRAILLRIGSHQSMPGADVSLSGSTSCHPKAASSPFRSATSCRALHYSTRATLSAFRVSSSRARSPS